jgi:rhodanese-related sulfurtransferase
MIGLVCLFAMLSLWRVVQHLKLAATVRGLRLEPDQLRDLIESAAQRQATPPFIIDLRQPKDFQHNPFRLPNALRLTPSALRRPEVVLPKDGDVILYCSCPNQATSTFWAMRLNRLGAQRVRLLHGGWEAWRNAGYPLES